MKKILILSFFLSAFLAAHPASEATISGTWKRTNSKEIKLYRIISGRLDEIAKCPVREDATFNFAFQVDQENFYVIGENPVISARNKYLFYFKPGDQLQVEVNDSTYLLTGKNTPENEAVCHWHNFIYPLEKTAVYSTFVTYVDFFPLLEEFAAKNYTPIATGNAAFNRSFADIRKFDVINWAVSFLMMPHPAHPEKDDFVDFYKNIQVSELTSTTGILSHPFGSSLLNKFEYLRMSLNSKDSAPPSFDDRLAGIKNDTLKGELVISNASGLKSYAGYLDYKKQYGKYLLTEDQKTKESAIVKRLAEKEKNNNNNKPAINFSGEDIQGKKINLSDFKGKVVVIDAWATWCGPCKKEFPYLKKLEEAYHDNKNVVFMGVSVNHPKDLQKWKDFIVNENMGGVQIFAGGMESEFAKLYEIKTIPRFIVVDAKGNLVSPDGPRPSSPELKFMIDSALKNSL